jgi:cell division septum initiation protein DivIVA
VEERGRLAFYINPSRRPQSEHGRSKRRHGTVRGSAESGVPFQTQTPKVVESNHAFIDKIKRENASMAKVLAALGSGIFETEQAIVRCRAETVASIEPKMQKLLSHQRIEFQRLEAIYQAKLTDAKRKCATDKAHFRVNWRSEWCRSEECKQSIDKMDQTVRPRRVELQAAIDWKMKAIPAKIEEGDRIKMIDLALELIAIEVIWGSAHPTW